MSFQPAADVPIIVTVPSSTKSSSISTDPPRSQLRAERRINPSWTLSLLKAKLELVTGIPPGSQQLRIRTVDGSWVPVVVGNDNEGERRIGEWGLRRGGEMEVQDSRPPSQRLDHLYTIPSDNETRAEKYTMPASEYEKLPNSVLAWKRRQKLGRFDPNSTDILGKAEEERRARDQALIKSKEIEMGQRCCVGGGASARDGGGAGGERRGQVRFVGEIEGLGGEKEKGACWVGVECDEPVGRNDGSVVVKQWEKADDDDDDDDDDDNDDEEGHEDKNRARKRQKEKQIRLFECRPGFGLFVRPDKIEVGAQWVPLDDLEMDGDMDEL